MSCMNAGSRACRRCGQSLPSHARFCRRCGLDQGPGSGSARMPQTMYRRRHGGIGGFWLIIVLIWIFMGGGHHGFIWWGWPGGFWGMMPHHW